MLRRLVRAFRGSPSAPTQPERAPDAVRAGRLAEVPPEARGAGGLAEVPLAVVRAYTGLEVTTVRPLDRLGPEGGSIIGAAIRRRLRDAGVADPDLPAGELIAGQNAARLARMRAEGMSDEQIAMMQAALEQRAREHRATGWTLDLAGGHHASVTLHRVEPGGGSHEDSRYTAFHNRFVSENSGSGSSRYSAKDDLWEIPVAPIVGGPYPAFSLPGHLAARGGTHDADATAASLGNGDLRAGLTAIAFLALAALEA